MPNPNLMSGSLMCVRFPILSALGLLSSLACAQIESGVFRPKDSDPVQWNVSRSNSLVWGTETYRPLGLRIPGNAKAIETAASQIKDVIVELPASGLGWQDAITDLEARGMRYVIALNSLAPAADGFLVEPATYRINGLMSRRQLDIRIPGCQSALIVLAVKRDGSVTSSQRVKTTGDRIRTMLNIPEGIEHVALIYPEVTDTGVIDLWEEFDNHRDQVLRSLKTHANHKGLRGLLNPLGATFRRIGDPPFVPKSTRFRSEFSAYLEQRYRSKDTAMRVWNMNSAEIADFNQLARLVPLWMGQRGVGMFWDPETDKLYPVEHQRSQYWNDLRQILATIENRRFNALVTGIRRACDVPILQEWHGWIPWYEAPNSTLSGIGARINGTDPVSMRESAGRAASSLMRWNRPGWMIASNVDAANFDQIPTISEFLDQCDSLGIQGSYFRTDNEQVLTFLGQEQTRRLGSSFANFAPLPLYYPEVAHNPAHTMKLPFGRWWLPAPIPGNRIDIGDQFFAYRLDAPSGSSVIMWAKTPLPKVKLRFLKPKEVTVTALDGTPVPIKVHRNAIELAIGEFPIIIKSGDDIPAPEPAQLEATTRFDTYVKTAQKLQMDIGDESFFFKDSVRTFDTSPGASLIKMYEILTRINQRMAPYMWIEAEAFKTSTFSEVQLSSGASDGAVISLRSNILGLSEGYRADFQFQVRTGQEVEVWVAARIPQEFRDDVSVVVAGQTMRITEPPVSIFGADLAWYKLGTSRLAGNMANVSIVVNPAVGMDLVVDAIVLYPGSFRPNGIRQPDALALIGG